MALMRANTPRPLPSPLTPSEVKGVRIVVISLRNIAKNIGIGNDSRKGEEEEEVLFVEFGNRKGKNYSDQ